MRKLLYGLGAAGIALWAQFGEVAPSEAAIIYPWCAHYGGRMGAPSCGFVNYQQCAATIAGMGGYCEMNPFYNPPPQRLPRRHREG